MDARVKTCFKCGLEKSLDDFYVHKQMGDGHLNKCKDCAKLDMRIDRHTKPRVREYDRSRANLPHRIALRLEVCRKWRAAHPDRARAHHQSSNALRSGRLNPKPECCEGCGLPKRLEKHHPDYAKPLFVVWLCKPCHAIADKIRRRLEAEAMKVETF